MQEELLSSAAAPERAAASVSASRYSGTAMSRYKDAYLHAQTINGIGQAIKVVSLILGGLIALIGFFSCASDAGHNTFGGGAGMIGGGMLFIMGVVLAVLGFAVGILVQSQGQQLKAHLDCAVHGSPFLNDEQRATAMSLN